MTAMALTVQPVLEREPEPRASVQASEAADLHLTVNRLRRWGVQSALAIFDQGLTAAAGFGVNLVLARWLPAEAYGAFAVAFAGYLFVSGFHNVLLLEPLSVLGPARHTDRLRFYFHAQIKVHGLLVGILAIAVLFAGLLMQRFAPQNPLAGALIGSALAVPFLLLLWLVRRICYVLKQPSTAVLGSAAYFVLISVSLGLAWLLGKVTPCSVFLLMGLASLLSSVLLLWRLRLRERGAGRTYRWRSVLRENWTYGRWLVGSAFLFAATSQLQTVLAAAFLGLGSAGILRAMQIPSLVMTQVITATGLLVLPVFSYDFGRGQTERLRKRAVIVSAVLVAGTIVFVLVLAAFARPLEHILFGGKYASYAWLMPVLALVPALNGFATGYSVALRASQKPQCDLIANLVAAPVGLVSAVLLMRFWGLGGAAASMVLGFLALSITTFACFHSNRYRLNAVEALT
jgi:O-antigen/teichoic acid export membrane protein